MEGSKGLEYELLVRAGNHNENHPCTPQQEPAKKNDNKEKDYVVIMKPCFNFLQEHKTLHRSF